MSNVLKKAATWTVDTVGILSTTPVRVKFIQFYPNAASDAFELDFWDESAAIANSNIGVTATITSTTTFTATTAVLTSSAFPQYATLGILRTNGSQANVGRFWIATTGGTGNTVITTTGLTAEVAKGYGLSCYQNYVAFTGLSVGATYKKDDYYFFGDKGLYLPNLALKSISTSAVLYIGIAAD